MYEIFILSSFLFCCLWCRVCIFAVYKCKNFIFISNFCRVLNVVCFLLGNSRPLNFICRRFGTLYLFLLHKRVGTKNDSTQSFFVPTRL
jgi:hypothetical protein